MTVYCLFQDEFDVYEFIAVFSTEDLAWAYVDAQGWERRKFSVEAHVVDERVFP